MDNDLCRSVGFHAPPQRFDTHSASSLTMANWDLPISSAMEVDRYAQSCLLSQNWSEQSIFESALSSLVSSPATTEANSGDGFAISELIGKLCNFGNSSGEFLPSSSSSCYTTPLNSPPKLEFPAMPSSTAVPELSADAGFAERAARFSCFGNRGFDSRITTISANGKVPRAESNPSIIAIGSRDKSTASEQVANGVKFSGEFSRKRKSLTKAKVKESSVGVLVSINPKKDRNDPNTTRIKSKGKNPKKKSNAKEEEDEKQSKSNKEKSPEPTKDYIHVRARRGQATDSHSLAERVRREKISERMKLLQNIVPGCNKVTGKALMLDEIINYVQSLQRQVEFLSMKLASVNNRLEFDMDSPMSKNISEMNNCSQSQSQVFQYDSDHSALLPMHLPPPPPHQYSQNAPQYTTTFCEDDLQAIVQMGFGHKQKNSDGRNQERQTGPNPLHNIWRQNKDPFSCI